MIKALFFGLEGRLNRLSFLLLSIILIISFIFIYNIANLFQILLLLIILKGFIFIIYILAFIFLFIKRCHDFGKSCYFLIKYFFVIFFILLLMKYIYFYIFNILYIKTVYTAYIYISNIFKLIAILYFFIKPGIIGANQYGNKPKKLFDLGLNSVDEEKSSIIF